MTEGLPLKVSALSVAGAMVPFPLYTPMCAAPISSGRAPAILEISTRTCAPPQTHTKRKPDGLVRQRGGKVGPVRVGTPPLRRTGWSRRCCRARHPGGGLRHRHRPASASSEATDGSRLKLLRSRPRGNPMSGPGCGGCFLRRSGGRQQCHNRRKEYQTPDMHTARTHFCLAAESGSARFSREAASITYLSLQTAGPSTAMNIIACLRFVKVRATARPRYYTSPGRRQIHRRRASVQHVVGLTSHPVSCNIRFDGSIGRRQSGQIRAGWPEH